VGTVIPDLPPINRRRQSRWDRFERADLLEQYRALRHQGLSARQAAKALAVPSTTLQAWRVWHGTLDSGPHVAACFQSGPGLAFFPRLVIACQLVSVAVGACGMRLVCRLLQRTGRDRFVAASSGAQQQVNGHIAQAMVAYGHDETARLAQDMPRKDRTVTQDETFPGGLCLLTMDPDSNCILLEQLAQTREQVRWNERMAPALAPRNGRVRQSTSDEAPGLLASVEHSLEAHHSPDLFHGQPELVKAVCGPMATQERAAHKALTEAREQLERVQSDPQSADEEPKPHSPSRPPPDTRSLEHAEHALAAARRAHARLAEQRAPGKARIRGIGHADHCVDLERGVRRNGRRMASAIPGHIEQMRSMAQHEGRSQSGLERIEKAERVGPKRPATIAFVSGSVKQQVAQLVLTPLVSCAMHAKLIPSSYLDRVAGTRTVSDGASLRELAERRRAPWFEPGGAVSALGCETQDQLHNEAKRWATVCQRSRSNVEGRNGSVSLRSHQRRGLDRPRQRECCTTIHNFFLPRPDGTTAAERFFGQQPRAMFRAIVASVELAPAPLSPPRKAESGRSHDRGPIDHQTGKV
jgi:Family of unknown function (DUF6399)